MGLDSLSLVAASMPGERKVKSACKIGLWIDQYTYCRPVGRRQRTLHPNLAFLPLLGQSLYSFATQQFLRGRENKNQHGFLFNLI